MSNDTRLEGLREAGIIADAVFDEQDEGSRGQTVAARIRHLIVERMVAVGLSGVPAGSEGGGQGTTAPSDSVPAVLQKGTQKP